MIKLILFTSFVLLVKTQENRFALNILHYNDFHARFVETSPFGGVCNPEAAPCIGGFARLATVVREAMAREPESLLLNAGDSFQGTIWYNLLRGNVTWEFMNMLPHDAHVLGNHEFDNGIEGVVPYLQNLDSEMVTANIIDDLEPTIQNLYKPSIVIEREGRRIGIIGVIIASTNTLASTGQLQFTDEVETVRQEAEKLHNDGVNIIIVLSHCGLDIDREIALHSGPHIDIIVGGHSHTLLYNGEPPEDSAFTPQGPYPVIVEQDTRSVLIVQAAAHTQYLGEIKLYFDDVGSLLEWEGHPHYIGNEIEQAPDVLEKINEYLPMIEELAKIEVGSSMVYLASSCACAECNLGSFICDAFMNAVMDMKEGDNWHYAHFCVMNQGAIRSSMEPGIITYETVLLSTPFENNVEVFELRGDHILEMLEYSVANDPYPGARMLQVSGIRSTFDGARPVNERVVNVTIRCIDCDVPRYEPLQLDKYYTVVSQTFLGEGGDGFSAPLFHWALWASAQGPSMDGAACPQKNILYNHIIRFGPIAKVKSDTGDYEVGHRPYNPHDIMKPHSLERIRTVFDGSRSVGDRVINVTVRCIECDVPVYEPLVQERFYKMVTTDFIGAGGGEYNMISDNRRNVEVAGVDYDVLMRYIEKQSPVFSDIDGRIQISNPCMV